MYVFQAKIGGMFAAICILYSDKGNIADTGKNMSYDMCTYIDDMWVVTTFRILDNLAALSGSILPLKPP